MNIGRAILIKQVKPESGRDTKIFRAYAAWQSEPSPHTSLKISCSCTSNVDHGALNCAAKAFIKYVEPGADFYVIQKRITLTARNTRGLWLAELQANS